MMPVIVTTSFTQESIPDCGSNFGNFNCVEVIPVEKEISYLEDYVDLQRLRKDDRYQVSLTYSKDVKGFSIEPLLLIPFVENAFKHLSSHTAKNNFVRLELARSNGHFIFSAENSKDEVKATDPYSGIGLNNVKRRLELLYPGKHELTISDEESVYRIDLTLKIDEKHNG
ncbi:MAG: GHKL domain-containing protein [Chitinophagaceae bacterium]|nr:MAG: GHKL domain-containing protein [Chitinophagaceae bacterium]